ncbi:YncE family protein [Streptomyces paludis]|uniref:Endoglucanase n=1 Tax=Streptomyces paludis TaxID=2282738 RepID=A0A345HNQ3_9ACTN|nr:endoglucanase [Streptomyces paludis]AXG78327.1 endoglucanase [Streptomyces paludis]
MSSLLPKRHLSKRGRLLAATAAAGLLITGVTGAAPVAAVAVAGTAVTASTGAAVAAVPGSGTGPTGQTLTVSATEGLAPKGATVTVTGSGYALDKGVYLAFCVVPETGKEPTPCLGGADTTGSSGSSYWISSNPPPYAVEMVKPFTQQADGKGGFELQLTVKAQDAEIDCTQVRCAVVTKADHTHITERAQDVIVPVTFGTGDGDGNEEPTPEVPEGTVRHALTRSFGTGPAAFAVDSASGSVHVSEARGLTTYDPETGEPAGDPLAGPGTATAATMAVDPDAGLLYVPRSNAVAVVNSRTGEAVGEPIAVPGNVGLMALDPAGKRLYVAVSNAKSVLVYDTESRQAVGAPVALPFAPYGLTVDPVHHIGYAVYVGGAVVNGTYTFANNLEAIDGETATLTSTVSIGTTALGSQGVAVDPTTRTAYVGNIAAGTVSVVDLAAGEVTGTIPVGGAPKFLAFDAETKTLYAGRLNSTAVAVVDMAGDAPEILDPIELPGSPSALALDGPRHTAYALADGKVHQIARQVSPKVTRAPEDTTVEAGTEVALTAAADATPAPVALWEVSPDDGQTWNVIADSAAPELTFTARAAHDGYRYRAVFSNVVGSVRTSAARLTVEAGSGNGGTDGGSTDGGGTDGGSTDGGSTDGGTDGGSTDGGADGGVDGGADGGSTDGGSTDGGTDGGATDGGSTDGGTDGGSTDGGSTTDGGTSTAGGSTAGGSATGGSSGSSTSGGTVGGSDTTGGVDTIGGTGGGLASTGSSVLPLAGTAALLILAGAAAVLVRRRRTSTAG